MFETGLALTKTGQCVQPWWQRGATLDADFSNSRFFFGGSFGDEAAFLVAVGGIKTGSVYTIGPSEVSMELLSDPGFDTGFAVDGWQVGGDYTGVGSLSDENNQLKLSRNSTGQCRVGFSHTQAEMRAYRFRSTLVSADANMLPSPGTALVAIGSGDANLYGARQAFDFTNLPAFPDTASVVWGADKTTFWSGLNTNVGVTGDIFVDDCSLKEVAPFVGFGQNGLTFFIAGTMPASASGDKVVLQFDDETSEKNRVRLVWDSSKHLRLIVTWAGADQASIDFGIVDVNTDFEVRVAGTKNELYARLDDEGAVFATLSWFPGLATLRLGQSYTGEDWDGLTGRLSVWAGFMPELVINADKAFAVFGDSTAAGSGSSSDATQWYSLLYTGYTPDRLAFRNATGGQSVYDMVADVVADAEHDRWLTVFYDRVNTGITSSNWLAQIALAVEAIATERFLIMPQVAYALNDEPDATVLTAIQEINAQCSFYTQTTPLMLKPRQIFYRTCIPKTPEQMVCTAMTQVKLSKLQQSALGLTGRGGEAATVLRRILNILSGAELWLMLV